ncbi:beta-galactosidase [Pedobacter sp. BMA]|nr:beta-galactosidase [Pedobacter sp. BMA]
MRSLHLLMVVIICSFSNGQAQTRSEFLLTKNWKFSKGDHPESVASDFNDSGWETVTVPHDWAIKGPFDGGNDSQDVAIVQNGENKATRKTGRTGGLPFIGKAWYRNTFVAPAFKKGKKVVILIDGAMSNPLVYFNGEKVGHWAYGYNSFFIDVTRQMREGQNTIAVGLENKPEASRWYPGAGLYRNVHVIITEDISIPVWGTYITTPLINKDFAKVKIKTQISGVNENDETLSLQTSIKNAKGETVATATKVLLATDLNEFEQDIIVKSPELWSPEMPNLYQAITKLYAGKTLKDEYTTTFGIRTIKYEAQKGFSLNGVYRKFKGVCNHHDLGPLGTAINVAALRRQLVLLKDMGCDAIRTSHNMPAPELVKLCDEMGFMMMVESFDEWKAPKVRNGYSHLFDEWAEKDVVNMVHANRNHPCVVMWSIGNEVPDQGTKNGGKILEFLQDICHREDPTRPVTVGMDRIQNALDNNFAAVLDVPGFNYKPNQYEMAYTRLPQGFILGTETASTVSSRGVYKFPVVPQKQKMYDDNQSSSYDLEYCNWSQIPDDEFVKQDDLQYVIGEFVWTGFDYLGEPTPYDEKWPSHSSYFGIIDLAGIPKDRYYLYRSKWNTAQSTLHTVPHWTFPGREGQVTPIFAYTSYASAELFVNGKSQGKQFKSHASNTNRYRLMWKDVKYDPGTIKVIAYDENGKVAAEETVKTAGKPHHVKLETDRKTLIADGQDLAYVTASIVDVNGNVCPDANDSLSFQVTGNGSYKVVANGDATNLELFHLPHMKAFNGKLVVTVQSTNKAGSLNLQVSGKGLKTGTIAILTK